MHLSKYTGDKAALGVSVCGLRTNEITADMGKVDCRKCKLVAANHSLRPPGGQGTKVEKVLAVDGSAVMVTIPGLPPLFTRGEGRTKQLNDMEQRLRAFFGDL